MVSTVLLDKILAEDILTVEEAYEMVAKLNVELESVEGLSIIHKTCVCATGGYMCIKFTDFVLWDSENWFEDVGFSKDEKFYVVLKRSLFKLLDSFVVLRSGLLN